MGCPFPEHHTTGGGSSGIGTAMVLVLAAIAVVRVAGPVVHAAAELAEILAIAVAILAGLALAAGAAVVALRLRQRQANGPARVSPPRPVPWQRAEPLPAPRRPAIESGREVHLHFHGTGAEDLAEILARVNQHQD